MIVDCCSDLHGNFPKLEGGDLLIIAGDLTARDTMEEHATCISWMEMQKYKKIVFIAGNHDNFLQEYGWDDSNRPEYLSDSGTEFMGYRIWGCPWTKTFEGMNPHCMAFTKDTEEELNEKFLLIPKDVDILITHSPPFTILDTTESGRQVGSTFLMAHHICETGFRPKLWVFGHIHEAYGLDGPYQWNKTKYVNASHVNERYQPVNKPIRIIL